MFISDAELKQMKKNPVTPEKEPGFLDEVVSSIGNRRKNVAESFDRESKGQQTKAESVLNVMGQGVGLINDTIGAGINKVVSDEVKKGIGTAVSKTPIPEIAAKYQSWAEKNPRVAKDLESATNIASLFAYVGGGKVATQGAIKGTKATGELISSGASKVKPKLGEEMIKAGTKIQDTVIRPQRVDIKNGFDMKNVVKYDLGGDLSNSFNKTQTLLKDSNKQLKTLITQNGDIETTDLTRVMNSLKQQEAKRGIASFGTKSQTLKAIENIEKELDLTIPDWRDRKLTFQETIDAKRASGLNASFLHDPLKKGINAEEAVWNNLYRILKRESEKVAPAQFKEVNKKISELIPIEQALIRRIPVAERNNVLSLPDIISLTGASIEPSAISISIINRILKSGKTADILMKTGKKLSP